MHYGYVGAEELRAEINAERGNRMGASHSHVDIVLNAVWQRPSHCTAEAHIPFKNKLVTRSLTSIRSSPDEALPWGPDSYITPE